MRPQPLISVHDVAASSRWYERLLGAQGAHGGDEYQRLTVEGALVLQLHRFDVAHHHGAIGDPSDRPYGNGVLLWFEVDDFEAAMTRVAALAPEVVRARHVNPNAGHWEIWLRDPDGYQVVLASRDATG